MLLGGATLGIAWPQVMLDDCFWNCPDLHPFWFWLQWPRTEIAFLPVTLVLAGIFYALPFGLSLNPKATRGSLLASSILPNIPSLILLALVLFGIPFYKIEGLAFGGWLQVAGSSAAAAMLCGHLIATRQSNVIPQ